MSLCGHWDLESSENFEEYMKELGIGFVMRKAGNTVKPSIIIERNGNKWSVNIRSTFKNHDFTAEEGVEVSEKTIDGRDVKSTLTMESETKMVVVQNDAKTGKLSTIVYKELVDGKLVETLKAGNVVAVRKYVKVA